MSSIKWISLIAGSALGGVSRYFLSAVLVRNIQSPIPVGTLSVNLLGCFLIGFIYTVGQNKFELSSAALLFLVTGFCGAFTTFSTFMVEIAELVKIGKGLVALGYVTLSVIAGFILFTIGTFLGRLF